MKFAAVMVVAFALSACGAGTAEPAATDASETAPPVSADASPGHTQPTQPQASATPTMVASEDCSGAFGAMLPELNSIEAMESRLPAIEACTSLDEWLAAGAEHPELVQALVGDWLDEPLASLNVLGEGCALLDDAVGASLCEELAAWCESNVANLSQPPCQQARPMSR